MEELIAKDPRNQERIFPYIGGKEVNDSPTQAHHRYVINFGQMTETEARRWPDLMKVVDRTSQARKNARTTVKLRLVMWWQYGEKRIELYNAIRGLDRVLVARS